MACRAVERRSRNPTGRLLCKTRPPTRPRLVNKLPHQASLSRRYVPSQPGMSLIVCRVAPAAGALQVTEPQDGNHQRTIGAPFGSISIMSTQGQAIPLRHQPHDAGYRLLELPPELQSLLESDTAPVSVTATRHPTAEREF